MPLSASTHAAIGALSGVIEVTLLHPTVAWKNALQEGRALNFAPTALYRGYLINVGSFAPITMAQFGVNRLLETRLSKAGDGASSSAPDGLPLHENPEPSPLAPQAPISRPCSASPWRRRLARRRQSYRRHAS